MANDPNRNPALAYWPQIEYAAANRMATADLWATLREAARELGLDSPGVTLAQVNELRHLATGIQAGSRRLDRVDPLSAITDARLIAEAPWSRSAAERAALPMYQVRYQHTVNGPNGEETAWRTSTFRGSLPRTLADLRGAIDEDAENLADKYGGEHLGVSGLQILAV
jgi:hypothetical protein